MTKDQLTGCAMRNLTNRETVGELFYIRSCFFGEHQAKSMAARFQFSIDLGRACELKPDEVKFGLKRDSVFKYYNITAKETSNDLMPLPGIKKL